MLIESSFDVPGYRPEKWPSGPNGTVGISDSDNLTSKWRRLAIKGGLRLDPSEARRQHALRRGKEALHHPKTAPPGLFSAIDWPGSLIPARVASIVRSPLFVTTQRRINTKPPLAATDCMTHPDIFAGGLMLELIQLKASVVSWRLSEALLP
jgi:hypothetical protein